MTTTPALSDPRRPFAALLAQQAPLDLAEAALLVARDEYPELEAAPYLAMLDAWAARVRDRLTAHPTPVEAAGALRAVLFDEMGFRGNTRRLLRPAQQLPQRRARSPRSASRSPSSVVYMEVGRRAGSWLEGLGAVPATSWCGVGGTPGVAARPFFGGTELSRRSMPGPAGPRLRP